MKETRLDFCGFRWKGIHSSTFGIWRVSEGSRYSETLLPAFQDETVKMPGQDGTLYWKSSYTNKQFSINIAFDKLTEKQLRELRAFFSAKERGELIFDEAPYKAYTVKVQNPPQLKTICFDEKGQRVYKGEGTLSFVAYYPFARAPMKFLDEYSDENKKEWESASGLLASNGSETYDKFSDGKFNLYNPGDLASDFKLTIPFPPDGSGGYASFSSEIALALKEGSSQVAILTLKAGIEPKQNDSRLLINSATQLIEGIDANGNATGNLYNQYITSGEFFQIPTNSYKKNEDGTLSDELVAITLSVSGTSDQGCTIEYDYLYY